MENDIETLINQVSDQSNWEKLLNWISTSGLQILFILAGAYILVRFGSMFINRIIHRSLTLDKFASAEEEQQREDTLKGIIGTAFTVIVYIATGLMILSKLGIDVAPLLAGAGIAGIAIGFGAQSMVKDFLAGTFIILENQYRVNDVIEIKGVSGLVEKISMRETVIRDLDGNVHHIPNGSFDMTTNMTMEFARINIDLQIAYDSDLEEVEKVVNEIGNDMLKDEEWRDKIVEAPHFKRVESFGDSAMVIKILGTTKPMKQWAIAGEFRKRLKIAFDKHGIVIPFPQTVIHQAKDKPKTKKKS